MTGCIGVFMVTTGFRFEKPRSGNPCEAWAAADYRGIRGFISTAGKFFIKITMWITWINLIIRVTKKIFSDRKNPQKPQKPRFYDQTGRDRRLPRSGQEILMGSIRRGLWIGQGETIRLNVCYYR